MTSINPWSNIKPLSKRRVDAANKHDVFWFTNHDGKLGFLIETSAELNYESSMDLKGILVTKREVTQGISQFILVLHNNNEWQLFEVLCHDLVAISKLYDTEIEMIKNIELRLNKWQRMLQLNNHTNLSIERQMGLFSELSFLLDEIMRKINIRGAVESWTGADYDKQDFAINETTIEIKSHTATKGNYINISSVDQLKQMSKYLYLVVYSLNLSEKGTSCGEVVSKIRDLLELETVETMMLFENKLINYGYIPSLVQNDLQRFDIVRKSVYLVNGDFPKIASEDISPIINHVQYSIDLDYCTSFLLDIESIHI